MRLVGVRGGAEMLRDCLSAGRATRRDYSGLQRMLSDLDLLDDHDYDWSGIRVSGEIPYVL
jgi:hypothetical protein